MSQELLTKSPERLFDPQTMAPNTPGQARQFVAEFHGKRPPSGHPLDFQSFYTLTQYPSFAVLTEKNRQDFPKTIGALHQFLERLTQPAIPLVPIRGDLINHQNIINFHEASKFLVGLRQLTGLDSPEVTDYLADLALVLYQNSNKLWQVRSIIIPDGLKEVKNLKQEIRILDEKRSPTDAQKFRKKMKERVFYLLSSTQYKSE